MSSFKVLACFTCYIAAEKLLVHTQPRKHHVYTRN